MKKGIITIIILTFIASIFIASASETGNCRNECAGIKNIQINNCSLSYSTCKENCNIKRVCANKCYNDEKTCTNIVNSDFLRCSKKCSYLGKNITCLGGKYNAGDIFLDSCQICECGYNSRLSCKKTDFCNFNEILNDSGKCISSNGLFQPLCNGVYYDIVCSKANFCLCDGTNNYTCSADYYCLHNFNPSLTRRGYTVSGWKTLLGFKLGNIGICVKKPELPLCGNGVCDNIISDNNSGETSLNCPQDCK
jgi:hypothetical protein